jgi:hypothetical protein
VAPISTSEIFTVACSGDEVRERAVAWFQYLQHSVTEDAGIVRVDSGSTAKARLLAGRFLAPRTLPTRTEVRTQWTRSGLEVTLTCSSRGYCAKTGLKRTYASWFSQITSGIRTSLPEVKVVVPSADQRSLPT